MEQQSNATGVPPKQLLTIDEAAQVLNLSRSLMYSLVWSGEIISFKIGRARRVPVKAVTVYIERQFALAKGA